MGKKPILCLDFDGVIHSYYSGWKGPRVISDPPVPGAMRFIDEAMHEFEVHIFSSRSRYFGARRAMKKWLINHLENYIVEKEPDFATLQDPFNEQQMACTTLAKDIMNRIKWPTRKPPAFLTIDDRAMTFDGTFPNLIVLGSFRPWNKQEI